MISSFVGLSNKILCMLVAQGMQNNMRSKLESEKFLVNLPTTRDKNCKNAPTFTIMTVYTDSFYGAPFSFKHYAR